MVVMVAVLIMCVWCSRGFASSARSHQLKFAADTFDDQAKAMPGGGVAEHASDERDQNFTGSAPPTA